MSGRVIGMIPRNFIIILIENHYWYEDGAVKGADQNELGIATFYKTAKTRHLSAGDFGR